MKPTTIPEHDDQQNKKERRIVFAMLVTTGLTVILAIPLERLHYDGFVTVVGRTGTTIAGLLFIYFVVWKIKSTWFNWSLVKRRDPERAQAAWNDAWREVLFVTPFFAGCVLIFWIEWAAARPSGLIALMACGVWMVVYLTVCAAGILVWLFHRIIGIVLACSLAPVNDLVRPCPVRQVGLDRLAASDGPMNRSFEAVPF